MLFEILLAKLKYIFKFPFYVIYKQILLSSSKRWNRPKHIGIILDGNRRWARISKVSSVIDGHSRGADKLDEVLDWCIDFDIKVVTIWIFSTDNFSRPPEEVDGLMELIERKTISLMTDEKVFKNQTRIKFIGRLELLPESLQKSIEKLESITEKHDGFRLNVAIAYGGQEEIVDSFQRYVKDQDVSDKDALLERIKDLEPSMLNPYFYTSGQPDPDLIIRTSGEVRLSGFMLWQSAYSEFYFCDSLWPNFREIDFLRAMRSYHQRIRRYGQ